MDRDIRKYTKLYRRALVTNQFPDPVGKAAAYEQRLQALYASDDFKAHNVYPTMDVSLIYAVIAMCLELKGYGLSDQEIIWFTDDVFKKRKQFFGVLTKVVGLLPNCYQIAKRWNIDDHEKRVHDGSITYDIFEVSDDKIEYRISKCMYIEMFEHYGIRSLCKIFCLTDEHAYANLTRHVLFVRHSDLSDGDSCHDEIINKRRLG
jgi:hypothetical protein